MSTVLTRKRLRPEDLLAMPDEGSGYELVNGELVENSMGTESSWIAGEVYGRLREFNATARLGWVFPQETAYQCFKDDPDRVRKADVSFIRFGRLPGERLPEGNCRTAPDLAVEVISPNEFYSKVRRKVEEYLQAGVRMVWVIDPESRTVENCKPGGGVGLLRDHEELDGGDVLPAFRCRVAEVFPPAAG